MAEASATVREALVLAEQSGTPRLGLICTAAADHYIEMGRWDDALTVLEATAGMPGTDYTPILQHGQAALIAAHRDDWEKAEEHLAAVSDLGIDSPLDRSIAYCLLRARALAADREPPATRQWPRSRRAWTPKWPRTCRKGTCCCRC